MKRSTILKQLPIRSTDFVVEIGAGSIPYWNTKLILDKYPFENVERYGDIRRSAPVIKADAMKLPLADRSCDVIFLSHVIEHLPDPQKFLSEAKRCAAYVYLEFPSLHRELMYAWSFHRWFVQIENGQLVFYKNDIPQIFSDFFHTHYDFLLDSWSEERFEELNQHVYKSTDKLDFRISTKTAFEYLLEQNPQSKIKINYETPYGRSGATAVDYPFLTKLKIALWALTPTSVIKTRARLQEKQNQRVHVALNDNILARLRCQICLTGSLRWGTTKNELICNNCSHCYKTQSDVFDFDI